MISAVTGFVAGFIHVASGPDHFAAVAPLAVQGRDRGWATGLRWGLGHAHGVAWAGAGLIFLRGILPIDRISSWAERLVGVVLIGMGLWALKKALAKHVHSHEHIHEGHTHVHIHVHGPRVAHADPQSHVHTHGPFAIGTLHGLAGSSHLAGILPGLAFPTLGDTISYLASYCLATVVAMSLFSTAMSFVARRCELNSIGSYRVLMSLCSLAAFAVGGYWLIAF